MRNGAGIIPKGPLTSDNPSVSLAADNSLYTREPWGRGMRIATSALRASSQWQWFSVIPRPVCTLAVGIRPFYDGRGFGPPRSSTPTEDLPKSQQRADVVIGPYGWLQRVAATSRAAL